MSSSLLIKSDESSTLDFCVLRKLISSYQGCSPGRARGCFACLKFLGIQPPLRVELLNIFVE